MLTALHSRAPNASPPPHEPNLGAFHEPEQLHLTFPEPDYGDDGLRSLFRAVCWRRGQDPKLVAQDVRKKRLTLARWEFCWRARQIMRTLENGTEVHRYSLPMIGLAFKRLGRAEPMDHTSCLHAIREFQKLIDKGEA